MSKLKILCEVLKPQEKVRVSLYSFTERGNLNLGLQCEKLPDPLQQNNYFYPSEKIIVTLKEAAPNSSSQEEKEFKEILLKQFIDHFTPLMENCSYEKINEVIKPLLYESSLTVLKQLQKKEFLKDNFMSSYLNLLRKTINDPLQNYSFIRYTSDYSDNSKLLSNANNNCLQLEKVVKILQQKNFSDYDTKLHFTFYYPQYLLGVSHRDEMFNFLKIFERSDMDNVYAYRNFINKNLFLDMESINYIKEMSCLLELLKEQNLLEERTVNEIVPTWSSNHVDTFSHFIGKIPLTDVEKLKLLFSTPIKYINFFNAVYNVNFGYQKFRNNDYLKNGVFAYYREQGEADEAYDDFLYLKGIEYFYRDKNFMENLRKLEETKQEFVKLLSLSNAEEKETAISYFMSLENLFFEENNEAFIDVLKKNASFVAKNFLSCPEMPEVNNIKSWRYLFYSSKMLKAFYQSSVYAEGRPWFYARRTKYLTEEEEWEKKVYADRNYFLQELLKIFTFEELFHFAQLCKTHKKSISRSTLPRLRKLRKDDSSMPIEWMVTLL